MEVLTKDLPARVEAITPHTVIEFPLVLFTVQAVQVCTALVGGLLIARQELISFFVGVKQVTVRACDCLGGILDCTFAAIELLCHRILDLIKGWFVVVDTGVVGHSQRITLGVNTPFPVFALLPEVVLCYRCELVFAIELPHSGASTNVASYNCKRRFI